MKKKMLTLFFSMVLMISLAVFASAAMLGDVDKSGKVNAIDARLALRYSAKLDELDEEQLKNADVDNSGVVNAIDARKILRVAAQIDPPFEGFDIDEYLIEKGALNVAVPKDNAPFCYEENGELKGIDVSTMKKFASSVNLQLKLHPMSYDECLDAVKNGKCDMAVSYNYNGKYNGFAEPVSYYRNDLNAVVLKSSGIDSVEKINSDPSLKIGVLDNSVGKITVEKKAGESNVTAFETCKDAVVALKNGTIDVFVAGTEFAILTGERNTNVETLVDSAYYGYNHSVIVAEKNAGLLEKTGQYIKADGIYKYENIDDKMKLSASQNDITIVTGGTACIEVFADSFYVADPNFYVSSPYNDACKTHIEEINGKHYLFISAPSDIIGHQYVVLNSSNEIAEEFRINIFIDAEGPLEYQYFNDVHIPDFGAFTGTMPVDTSVITADGETGVVHTYLVEDLYNNGITDAAVLDAYLGTLEAAGFKYADYMETQETLTLIYVDENTGMVVTYVESFNSEGYVLGIGVGYLFPESV